MVMAEAMNLSKFILNIPIDSGNKYRHANSLELYLPIHCSQASDTTTIVGVVNVILFMLTPMRLTLFRSVIHRKRLLQTTWDNCWGPCV